MASKMQRARDFVRRNRERASRMMIQVRTDVETLGAAGAVTYARGRFGDRRMQVAGVDVELGIGVVSKLAAYSGAMRAASPDLHAIGNGVLAAYVTHAALDLGQRHASQDAAAQGYVRAVGPGNVSPIGAARAAAGVAR